MFSAVDLLKYIGMSYDFDGFRSSLCIYTVCKYFPEIYLSQFSEFIFVNSMQILHLFYIIAP